MIRWSTLCSFGQVTAHVAYHTATYVLDIVTQPIFIHSVFTTHRGDLVRLGPAKWTLLAVQVSVLCLAAKLICISAAHPTVWSHFLFCFTQALQFWWFYKIAKQFAPLVQVAIALLRSKMLRQARLLSA